ncbi:LLM class flavin-dependent oxidoreductase [Antrihabitans sp. YC3-6]|uniref:LLM class flavin-dependent oxidoreductase n=1 Tax=Antrihabitans stalagmiti TaxID=2799499 RepID=A0A934U335_9NOCA|nr:LLM class flavin-dependent oxidoreductase [Antrihabitans stalagmiti]MBJ8339405.1 LLM class flavin-dependent oxidoreductase [Antrihabitans stalagmiti]
MEKFGFLSFGNYGPGRGSKVVDAHASLHQAIDLSVRADELGVNGAYFRVHHFARQQSAPMTLLAAIAARTKHIEVGTGVIDLRYENPLYLAEEAASLDIIADQRIALGMSRGSPETVTRGYESFGYTGSKDPRGADIARVKFDQFIAAIDGEGIAAGDPRMTGSDRPQPIRPLSPGLKNRIWWGSATRDSAEWAGRQGVNLMSSTLLTEDAGIPFADLQAEQIDRFRAAWDEAGHPGKPRVSVSRSVFPLINDLDRAYFGSTDSDQVGVIDGYRSTFGKTYAAEPDVLIEQLRADAAVMSADTLMLTIPVALGVDFNAHILESFATHVAPALGWNPADRQSPVGAASVIA